MQRFQFFFKNFVTSSFLLCCIFVFPTSSVFAAVDDTYFHIPTNKLLIFLFIVTFYIFVFPTSSVFAAADDTYFHIPTNKLLKSSEFEKSIFNFDFYFEKNGGGSKETKSTERKREEG
jgi:hypothetical protein